MMVRARPPGDRLESPEAAWSCLEQPLGRHLTTDHFDAGAVDAMIAVTHPRCGAHVNDLGRHIQPRLEVIHSPSSLLRNSACRWSGSLRTSVTRSERLQHGDQLDHRCRPVAGERDWRHIGGMAGSTPS